MINIMLDIDQFDLKNWLWRGALDTLNVIIENNKFQDLMRLIVRIHPEPLTMAELNNFLGFKADWIYEQLDIRI